MLGFRIFLAIIFIAVSIYTVPVILNHGPNLFPVFFGDIAKMGWPGQFNFDFMCMLLMSGTYIAWRHKFSGAGLGLSLGGFFLGAPFLSAYLLYHSFQTDGDIAVVIVGPARSS